VPHDLQENIQNAIEFVRAVAEEIFIAHHTHLGKVVYKLN